MARTYDLTGALPAGVTIMPPSAQRSGGVSVTGTATLPPSFKINDPTLGSETSPAQWLIVRLSATSGTWAGVYFRTDAAGQYSFLIRGDGVMRTYNLWLGPVYNIPRSQSDTEKFTDPALAAEAARKIMEKGIITRGSSKLIQQNATSTVSTTAGSRTIVLSEPNDAILFSMAVKGPGIPAGATVASYMKGSTLLTLSAGAAALADATAVTATFQFPITVYPTCASGASAVVEFIKLQPQPEGPTVLIVDWCCPARALLRINTTTIWGVRVRNAGGITATGIRLSFSNLSAGLTTGAVRNIPDRIPPDEDRTIFFEVTSTVSGSFRSMDVTVTCDQGDSVNYTGARGWYYPAAPGGLTANVVPPPVAAPTKPEGCPLIGVWLFPPWKQWYLTVGHSFERRPELGFGSYENVNFWKWHIKWLSEHGVDYVLVEWIERIGADDYKTFARECIDLGLLPALESTGFNKLKFEINYICGGDHVALPRDRLISGITIHEGSVLPPPETGDINDYYFNTETKRLYGPKVSGSWNTTYYVQTTPTTTKDQCIYACNFLDMFRRQVPYFLKPSYLYTTGAAPKARYSFFNMCTGFYAQVTTGPGLNVYNKTADRDTFVATLLERANRIAIAGGVTNGMSWGGGETGGTDANADFWASLGFNRCSLYNWFGKGSPANVEDAENSHAAALTAWAEHGNAARGIAPQVCINAGFDNHRWKQNKRITEWTVTGWDYEFFKYHMQAAVTFLAGIPASQREVLINSLDEYGEGSYIAPIAQCGFKFLEAVREVFYPAATAPTIYGPTDVGMVIPQPPIDLFRWVATPTAYPVEDGNTNTKEGVQIPLGSYPAIEPARSIGCWTKLG